MMVFWEGGLLRNGGLLSGWYLTTSGRSKLYQGFQKYNKCDVRIQKRKKEKKSGTKTGSSLLSGWPLTRWRSGPKFHPGVPQS